ncbi:hypothetical protein BOX15_Mlig028936g3 [Macrostomum lignano]|uniref:PPM-type phosphatase domain-containing protein n=1 Tax=Macrostomum lignano TaxID=282301 RepID=A0A267G0K9_9PLAT|nr:hypothetical protein BOX15_Mlig028936g3 [Macrostomum lignano]
MMERLIVLKAHSNMLQELPNFREMPELRMLDLGCNQLLTGSVRDLMEARLSFLDLSCNDKMGISMQDLTTVTTKSTIKTVSSAGGIQSLSLQRPPAAAAGAVAVAHRPAAAALPFHAGLAESTGSRNRMCISVLNKMPYPTPDSGLFAVFDGGRNSTVPGLLQRLFGRAYWEQLKAGLGEQAALRYALLAIHRRLLGHGRRLGASGVILCLKRRSADRWEATVANCGNAEALLVQRDRPMRLSRLFTAQCDRDEAERVVQVGGMVTEDGRVNGSCDCTRQLGCAYLHPCVVPEPQVTQVNLTETDDSLILASRSFWSFVSYDEAAEEVREAEQPVAAAKRLIDLAQAYGSTENISILVVKIRLSSHHHHHQQHHQQHQQHQASLGRRQPQVPELEEPDYAELRLSLSELGSSVSSQQSVESDSSELWMRRRINGYQKLKSGRTVEEIERERREAAGEEERPRFAKRHETAERLGAEMRLRLAGEVKRQELDSALSDALLNSPTGSDSDRSVHSGDGAAAAVRDNGAGNWRRINAGEQQRGGASWADRRSALMSHAHRSLTAAGGQLAGVAAVVDFYDEFDDDNDGRLSEITNSELLLSPPRQDRIGDAGVDPDDPDELPGGAFEDDEVDGNSAAADGYESLSRYRPAMAAAGGLQWRPDAGHEGMREETYMVERQGAPGAREAAVSSAGGSRRMATPTPRFRNRPADLRSRRPLRPRAAS